MSLEFEYRRLAAACLELSKRAAALADKTRLLTIAEAWLDLAERVTRNRSKAKDGNGGTIAQIASDINRAAVTGYVGAKTEDDRRTRFAIATCAVPEATPQRLRQSLGSPKAGAF
jgi:hypothetical protein